MDLLSVEQASDFLHVAAETLNVWRQHNTGPPVIMINDTPHYRLMALIDWQLMQAAGEAVRSFRPPLSHLN